MKSVHLALLLLAASSLSGDSLIASDAILPLRASVAEVCEFNHAKKDGASCSVIGILTGNETVPRKLTTSELPEKWPLVSPSGLDVGFFRAGYVGLRSTGGTVPRNWDLYLIALQGTNELRITNMEFKDCYGMDFSPDGSNIVFSVMRNEYPSDSYFELRMIPAVSIAPGTKRFIGGRVLLHDDKHNILPVFSPDGKSILYVAKFHRKGTLKEVINPFKGTVFFKWELCLLDIATGGKKVLDVSASLIEDHRFLSNTGLVSYRKDGQTLQKGGAGVSPTNSE